MIHTKSIKNKRKSQNAHDNNNNNGRMAKKLACKTNKRELSQRKSKTKSENGSAVGDRERVKI